MNITRIAPSPTGDMHIGTARTAYFNWLAARATFGGQFWLRIDDTDQKRNNAHSVRVIFTALDWLGLDCDGVFYQSARTAYYREAADKLLATGWAAKKDGAIVLRIPPDQALPTAWVDLIAGPVKISADDIACAQDSVLIKSDGSPAYNFCSVVDDRRTNVNLIIRGTDHITNTAKQVVLWSALGNDKPLPRFAHVGLICVNNKPLSKRDNAASITQYMQAGVDPDALLNCLVRLGWGPTRDDKSTKLLPRDRMLELFLTGGKLRSSAAEFDAAKLAAFDRKYKARKTRGKQAP